MKTRSRKRGFTLIELMVVLGVVTLLTLLAAPSFQDMIVMQRLRGINAQVVTDMQFARSEAVTQGKDVRINLGSDANQTCYVLYTADSNGIARCDCTLGAGAACTAAGAAAKEIRTVTSLRSSGVSFLWPTTQDTAFGFDHVNGGLISIPEDDATTPLLSVQIDTRVDDDRRLRDNISQAGRPSVCAPNAAKMQVTAC